MTSLVERLRDRSDRKTFYRIDESDEDADFLPKKSGPSLEKIERIVRPDGAGYDGEAIIHGLVDQRR